MESTALILTGNTTDFTTILSPSIRLDPNKKYEAALLSVNLFNTIPNITEENNKFKYSTDNGATWKIISLNVGAYEIIGINDEIQRQMTINGDFDVANNEYYIYITTKIAESKSIINITNQNYRVDFGIENSIGSTLGFHPVMISQKYNISQEIVDITKINSVLVNVDFITGSYVNGTQSPAIYSFDPNIVSPG
jgi:competence protein ComGC